MPRIKGYLRNLGRGLIAGLLIITVVPVISMLAGIVVIGMSIVGQDNTDMIKINGEEE